MVSKLLLITVVGRLRVIVCPDAEVIISLVVPAIVNDCEVLTVPVPLSPAIPISIPVSAEPSMAGKVPVRFAAGILPDPVILFPLRSKLPPSSWRCICYKICRNEYGSNASSTGCSSYSDSLRTIKINSRNTTSSTNNSTTLILNC